MSRLRISTGVRTWLAGLQARDREAARFAGEAVTALVEEGPNLGSPLVLTVERALWDQHPQAAFDHAYRRRLTTLQQVRRAAADIATSRRRLELQVEQAEGTARRLEGQSRLAAEAGREDLAWEMLTRQVSLGDALEDLRRQCEELRWEEEKAIEAQRHLQAEIDTWRIRREKIKAGYAAGRAHEVIGQILAEAGEDYGDQADPPEGIAAVRSAADSLLEATPEGDRDRDALVLRELRLRALTGYDLRILFVIDHSGTVMLLAANDGPAEWWDWYDQVLPLVRGLMAEAAETEDTDGRSFAGEFFPEGTDLEAGAARLVARNRAHTLVEVRRQMGLSQAQVAERMNLDPGEVEMIERAEPGATGIRTLAAYAEALGGRLEIVADLGLARIFLE
jgi:hypothetical protein